MVFVRAALISLFAGGSLAGSGDAEDAVLASLKWLSRHQNADGSWKTQGYVGDCNKIPKYGGGKCSPNPGHEDFDAGNTGLATLAFLGAGYSHLSKDTYDGICFGDVVRKGLQWMMSHQDPEGCIGSRNAQKYMYNHAICALALSEAYGLTGDLGRLCREPTQKAVDFVIAAQNPGKGWRYAPRCIDNDTSVTIWAVMALKSAEMSGIKLPKAGYDGARAWFGGATDESGRTGYVAKGVFHLRIGHDFFGSHETMTAASMLGRILIDGDIGDLRLSEGAALLARDLPRWEEKALDFYYWHFGSLALHLYEGPRGRNWKAWHGALKEALLSHQGAEGDKVGSWEPADRWSESGGRVYATAINALTLSAYGRYPRDKFWK